MELRFGCAPPVDPLNLMRVNTAVGIIESNGPLGLLGGIFSRQCEADRDSLKLCQKIPLMKLLRAIPCSRIPSVFISLARVLT